MLPVKNFAYSKFSVYAVSVFSLVGFFLFFAVNYTDGVRDFSVLNVLLGLLGACLITRYLARVLIPTIAGKSALILDEEKLYYRVSNKTVYWGDVTFIAERGLSSGRGTYIAFELLDTNREIHITLNFLNSEDDLVYNTILDYFEQSLIIDGQLGYTERKRTAKAD
ncbi:hypothetical protein A0256_18125 [Mucilaginibacter sp. PAMC 26640]|nr:hypothetical protein A0256_18125 [Mucilaginibacter sp. PAMC 26640]